MTDPRPEGAPPGRRGGFTLIELIVVVAVISILVRIALPSLQEAVVRARAAAVLGDVDVIRAAALQYHADHSVWPPDAGVGVVPEELVPLLPEGFVFERDEYALDWENWNLPDGIPSDPGAAALLGVTVATEDPLLGNALANLMGGNGWYTSGDSYTVLIDRM